MYAPSPNIIVRIKTLTSFAGTCGANDAITISLVTPTESGFKTIESFHPNFTYPIFGEEEQIFGYKNLKVNLYYNATDMRPHLAVSSAKKFPSIGEVEPFNVVEEMKEYLPGGLSHFCSPTYRRR